MKYVYFANNRLGLKCLEWLMSSGQPPLMVVTHEGVKARLADEIREASGLSSERMFTSGQCGSEAFFDALRHLSPETGLSVLYGYRLPQMLLEAFPLGVVNLHLSFLPCGKGANPNVWGIVEQTAAGVTLHRMDEGLDTGPVLKQEQVPQFWTDTGKSLYERLEKAALGLLKKSWPDAARTSASPKEHTPAGDQRTHTLRDFESLRQIDLDEMMTARDWINRLRALTFPPHQGAWFEDGGKRYSLQLRVCEELET